MTHRVEHLAEALRAKITVDAGGCWLWTAFVDAKGYGTIRWDGKVRKAHRVVYECMVGPIPVGLQIDHLCRIRHCVNPDHLEPVTCRENIARGQSGKRNREKTHCPQGHEYVAENTYVHRGKRQCRTCVKSDRRLSARKAKERDPEWRARRREYIRKWYAQRDGSTA